MGTTRSLSWPRRSRSTTSSSIPAGTPAPPGPVVGRFLTGLRDGELLGVRLSDGRVLVPPTEYDPTTSAEVASEGDHWVTLGPAGRVQSWTWVAEPRAGKHALTKPFAFALDPARWCRHRAPPHGRLRIAGRDHRRLARRAALAGRAHRSHHRHRSVGTARRRRRTAPRAAARAGGRRAARHRHRVRFHPRVRTERRAGA